MTDPHARDETEPHAPDEQAPEPAPDEVDAILAQWQRERPDLDVDAMGLLGRFGRVHEHTRRAIEEVFVRHGLQRGEFDVLATLRRSGPPFTLIPSVLAESLMLSRAGMTNRIDRLEAAGLVARRLDPADRRSFLVALTDLGRETIDAAVTDHTANQTRVLAGLTPDQRTHLDDILRTLLRGPSRSTTGDHD
ncbi:MarR family transcriptional regulator [Streptomyces sp. SID3343]|uniref:MarR family winged helix-turn-helix transcriptional regulator n=1 Tax=Streptomyces sp. SID3343 TaxID=2690260 RepID=UPI00136A47ED|nr:MarR family transcriptional regulator [Streptomyces sp. SID3343]MYV97391.1 MarR family transcriptional regulator [Streptomyces sp. SID3343]